LRLLLVLPLLLSLHTLAAQSAATASSSSLPDAPNAHWSDVISLRSGTNVWVDTGFHSTHCKFQQATDQELTCDADGPRKFAAGEIRAVKMTNRAESAAVLGAVGAGVGIVVVKIVALTLGNGFFNGQAKGSAYAGGAGAGALIFAPIGYAAGFMHRTVYQAH
jgi:hypothetical protein